MDDSAQFLEWAMDTLEHEHPVAVVNGDYGQAAFPFVRDVSHAVLEELITQAHAASSGISGETTGGSTGDHNSSLPAVMDMEHDVCPPKPCSHGGRTNLPMMSWNFGTASALPTGDGTLGNAGLGVPETMNGLQPTGRAAARSTTSTGPLQLPMMAERKRRANMNQRFIELSTIIPGIKKMDKATILSDAAMHVKGLQQKIKALEAATGRNRRSVETVVKKPVADENGSPSSASPGAPAMGNLLPEVVVRLSENGVMVRILCDDAKGVVVRVLSELEGLHLGITHANTMPFTACTVIVTVTAEVDEGFTVTAEEILGRLNSALEYHSSCTATEHIGNKRHI